MHIPRGVAWMLLPALLATCLPVAAEEGAKESKKLALIHLLVRAGKNEEAANAMRSLYPKGPPEGAAAVEYYRIVGNSAKGWEEARQGLERLLREQPENGEYRIGLAQVLLMRPATLQRGSQLFSAAAKQAGDNKSHVLEEWRSALSKLDKNNSSSIPAYQEYLAADPGSADIRNVLADARRAEAQRLPWQLREKADVQLAAGHPEEAKTTLQGALKLDPRNAWVRFDLARLYHKQGDKKLGRATMEEGLSVVPSDADMLYANALYVSLLDEPEQAQQLLDKIPASSRSPAMHSLRQKVAIQILARQATAYARDGRTVEMQATMARAEREADGNPELLNIVANTWVDLQSPARGVALMKPLASRRSAPVGTRLYYAGVLDRSEFDDQEESAVLRSLSTEKNLTAKEREDLRYFMSSFAAHRADNARRAGNLEAARGALVPALRQDPDNIDLQMALARVHVAAHESLKAREIYQHVLQAKPDHLGARLALARNLSDAGQMAEAQQEMEAVHAHAAADDFDTHLAVAEWYVDTGNVKAASTVLAELRKMSPGNRKVLLLSGRIAKAQGHSGEAIAYYNEAGATDEVAGIERGRASGLLAAGVDVLSKQGGTSGVSNVKALEIPVEMRVPIGYDGGQLFAHVDQVTMSAGVLDVADKWNVQRYGKILALAPAGLAVGTDQSAHGTALALGYETDGMRIDLGTTPRGFPVSSVVGGIKWWHYTVDTGFSFDLSRRPVTSSLLSYAGAYDPITGQAWGGVTSSGASLHLSRDAGALSGFIDLGYYRLTGLNVLSNTEAALRTGFDWNFISDEDMKFTAGLAFTDWHYRENLRNYSFGHGGYYSPQKYYSLALPVRWTGRTENWSYLMQGSVSMSVSYEKDMLVYPTDAGLQVLAGNPVYAGGPGHGTGHSLTGALEYRFTPHWFGGGRFEIDRSAYYAPNFAILYLRYMFDAQPGAMPFPPMTLKPYSRF